MIPTDLQHAWRGLLRTPRFSAGVVALLALALGLALSIAAAVTTLLLRPLPYPGGERLVEVDGLAASMGASLGWSPGLLDDLAALPAVEAVGAYETRPALYADDGGEHPLAALSPELTAMLDARPLLGAMLTPASDADDALLSEAVWRGRYGADPAIVGRTLAFDGRRLRIVGVMSGAFRFPDAHVALWTPLHYSADDRAAADRFAMHGAPVLVRLRDGATVEQLAAQLQPLAALPALASLREHLGLRLRAVPLRERWIGERRELLALLGAAAAAVLALLFANLVALWLSRCVQRTREFAVRGALGAGPRRLGRLLAAELALLCAAALPFGIALAEPGLVLLQWLGVVDARLPWPVGVDLTTVLQGIALAAVLATALGAAAHMLAARTVALADLAHAAAGIGGARRPRALQRVLVGVQLALAIALLSAGTLLTRSAWQLVNEDPGFDARGVIVAVLASDAASTAEPAALLRDVAALPGVASASFTSAAPFASNDAVALVRVRDGAATPLAARDRAIGRDYLQTMRQPVLRGHGFGADGAGVLVDERFVELHLQGRDPLQAALTFGREDDAPQWQPIVGVVATARHAGLDEQPAHGTVLQLADAPYPDGDVLVIRADLPVAAFATRLRALGRAHGLQVRDVAALQQRVRATLDERLHALVLVATFAACGTGLAALGLFALVAYASRQRRPEFALRLALGASRRSVTWLAVGAGVRTALPGLLCGMALAVVLGRVLASHLHRVPAFDGASLAVVAFAATAATLVACWLPARRTADVDPLVALRYE